MNQIKQFSLLLLLTISSTFFAQKTHYNTDNGFIAEGFDVVSYFVNEKPVAGNSKFQTTFDDIKFKFSSEENLAVFNKDPKKYIPQYGGFCAYAIAAKKTKMDIDAESYEIRDGKLYLFYNAWFSNKLENWKEEDTAELQKKGDKNWKELKHKKN
jgi:YHS domain-containing protein